MIHQNEAARPRGGSADRADCSLLGGENGSEFKTILPPLQVRITAARGNEPYGPAGFFG